jgi:bacillithiol biosynthesis cysteine-adding enzyme BshC
LLLAEIQPRDSSYYKKIILDYLGGKPDLQTFYSYPHAFGAFEQAMQERSFDPEVRKILTGVLDQQYETLHLSKKSPVRMNLEKLRDANTFTVTTGHQLCMLTGPVYFIYKIIHTIRLADELNKAHPDKHIVPVYWMASEDHDLDEVKSLSIDGKIFTWDIPDKDLPVGNYTLDNIDSLFGELEREFAGSEIPGLLQEAKKYFTSSSTLAEATFRLVHHLFEAYGLIVLEPQNQRLKSVLKPVMMDDILQQSSIAALNETNAALQALKYPLQVNGRAINFFYLSESGRKLLLKTNHGFEVAEGQKQWTVDQMQQEINDHPERFSPNVVLRPVYQESILPNLAYIGGPGELAYWLQLKGVFEAHRTFFPILLLRNSFGIVSHTLNHHAQQLKLDWKLYFQQTDEVRIQAHHQFESLEEKETARQIDETLQGMIDKLEKLDNRLSSTVIDYKLETAQFFDGLGKKIRKAKDEKYQHQFNQVQQIRHALFQHGTPTERIHNILHYARRQDTQAFIRLIYDASDPVYTGVKVLAY